MSRSVSLPSDRSFGLTFAGVFALIGVWSAWKSSGLWMAFIPAAALFLLLSFVASSVLRPLNTAWMWLGGALNRLVSPLLLAVIYFGLFTPIALVFRLRGRDALQRKFDKAARTYWIPRDPPGPDPRRSFPRQF